MPRIKSLRPKGIVVLAIRSNIKREQSQGEEIANSVSHGIGLITALAGTPFLIVNAVQLDDAGFIVGTCLFCATMILLYFASALYHALPSGKAKNRFRIIEHSAIFLLIAGTYTPLTLGVLHGPFGWTIFGIVWGLAFAGVVLKAFFKTAHPILSTCLYLFMGWLLVIAVKPLYASMPTAGLLWLIGGGLSYTIGVAFFATDSRVPYGHLIWHLFVISGTTCHFFLILWYAA
ncbi:PAQR family membrane homeostasis protein TrhA [Desulfosarcina ovata]|uniref:PAQR family membrane homeostasis protein TrhA n=1 Tax=Desulfosarcina ovata TaxID=83564 RepID=UPI0012D31471|nr:hemolysin III family protein [Desulfosarcina ovata]